MEHPELSQQVFGAPLVNSFKIREVYILIAVGMENREREKWISCQSNAPFKKKAAHIFCPRTLAEVLERRNVLIGVLVRL